MSVNSQKRTLALQHFGAFLTFEKLVVQRLRVLKVGRVEALVELVRDPNINWSQT